MNLFAGVQEFHVLLNHFILIVGLIGYILVLKVLVKYRKTSFKYPFYKICVSLAVFDFVGICEKIITPVCFPMFYPDGDIWAKIYGFLLMVPWMGVMFHQLLIAFDRWVALRNPHGSEERMFRDRNLMLIIAGIWVVAVGSSILQLTDTFGFRFGENIKYEYNFNDTKVQTMLLLRDVVGQNLVYVIIMVLYASCCWNVRKLKNQVSTTTNASQNRRTKAQVRMFIQGIIVTIPQVFSILCYYGAAFIPSATYLFVLVELINHLYNTINPFVYVLFSKELREKIMLYYFPNYKYIRNITTKTLQPNTTRGDNSEGKTIKVRTTAM